MWGKNLNLKKMKISIKQNFDELGYVHLKNIFSSEEITRAEKAIINLFALQIGKIGEYQVAVEKIINSNRDYGEKISAIYDLGEEKDKEALYQVQNFIYENLAIKMLYANPEFEDICKTLLEAQGKEILVNGPGLFVNKPNTQRLLYKWHSEQHYYPKRLNFLNVWVPIFRNKVKDNGTMSLKLRSHFYDFPFSEYQGYNKDTESKKNHFIQYEIPENFVKDFEEYQTVADVGDVIIFHRRLVHRSNTNPSDKHSYALVSRIWEPSNDLTISGAITVTPYGKGGDGRADLIVKNSMIKKYDK